jgi:hypothetical protein
MKEYLDQLLRCEDGKLYWKKRRTSSRGVNDRAGSLSNCGYRQVTIDGKKYMEHRVIWILYNGDIPDDLYVDHINMDKLDNRIENLRLLTRTQNFHNRESANVWRRGDSFQGKVMIQGVRYSKHFDTKEEAENWVKNLKDTHINGGNGR